MLKPVFIVAFSGHRPRNDDPSRLEGLLEGMIAALENSRCRLQSLRTLPSIGCTIRRVEDVLLTELIEWCTAAKNGLGH